MNEWVQIRGIIPGKQDLIQLKRWAMRSTKPKTSRMGPCPERGCCLILSLSFFYLLHSKAPLFILAGRLITIGACFAKAVKVALLQLFLVNHGRNDLPETDIA
jgi:hypothetical protein